MKIKPYHLETCIQMAKTSTVKRGKLGAILCKGSGEILCKAGNINVYGMKNQRSIHAEEYIIKKAENMRLFNRFPSEKFNLLVIRWKADDTHLFNAMPCIKCQKLLDKYNLNIYFSNYNGIIKQFK